VTIGEILTAGLVIALVLLAIDELLVRLIGRRPVLT
jgi:hypothetical protein